MKNLRLVLNNFIIKLASDLYSRVGMLVLVVFIARIYGTEQFGMYSVAFVLVNLFYIVTDLGLNILFIRDASEDIKASKGYWEKLLALKLLACFASVCMIGVTTFFFSYSTTINLLILIAIGWMLGNSLIDLINAYFTAMEKMEAVIKNTLLHRTLLYIAAGYCLITKAPLFITCSVIAISSLLGATTGFCFLIARIGFFKIQFDREFIKEKLKVALPIAMSGALMSIYLRVDTLMLSKLTSESDVGLYSSAFKLFETLFFIPTVFQSVLLPRFMQNIKNTEKLAQFSERAIIFMMLIALPINLGMLIESDWAVALLYGEKYAESSKIMALISPAVTFMFLHAIPGILLIAQNRQKINAISSFWAMLISVIGNLILIPIYGYYGASIMVVITQFITVVILFYYCREVFLKKIVWVGLFKLLFCSSLSGLFLYFVDFDYKILELLLFTLLFYSLTLLFGVVKFKEISGYFGR